VQSANYAYAQISCDNFMDVFYANMYVLYSIDSNLSYASPKIKHIVN